MKHKLAKRFQNCIFPMILMFFLLSAMPVSADSLYERDRIGSVKIELAELGTPKENVEFSLYQVGLPVENTTLQFELIHEFSDTKIDLNTLIYGKQQRQASQKLANNLHGKKPMAQKLTEKNGVANFADIEQGVYLAVQTEESQYGTVEPFLIYLPLYTKDSEWLYDLEVYPKAEKSNFIPTPTPVVPDKPTGGKIVQTSDSFNREGMISLLLLSFAAVIALLAVKKILFKNNKTDKG
ncbi:pilin N-terminal domain-containing protein [Scatolibacter rhodanostii]|uniref:pilin N-terminal domain-containing protein n=1 Tax=Scatolibacter rhodanostii TaxID=2014781 RepID=UPI000C07684F|nr:pilin N-terminal domain-containing protein [Scatolibacter rhodanostii]